MDYLFRNEATQGNLWGKGERGTIYVGAPAPLSAPFASAAVATPGGSRPTDSAEPCF